MLCEDIHPIYLRTSDLWDAYSLEDHLLQKVKLHLIKTHWLSGEGKWDRVSGAEPLVFFSRLFDVVRFLLGSECTTRVEKMVCVGSLEPGSTRIAGCYPDAFLQMAPGTPPTPGKFRWRDLVCPFEYTLGDDTTDVSDPESIAYWIDPHPSQDDAKAPQTAAHIMRSDPRRAFSFGVRVYGTTFSIWLLCRAASFAFAPFDWNEVGPGFVLWASAYLMFPSTLNHSSSSSSSSPHHQRRTLVSKRTSRRSAKPTSAIGLTSKGGNTTL